MLVIIYLFIYKILCTKNKVIMAMHKKNKGREYII
jgi:hypothetical protein